MNPTPPMIQGLMHDCWLCGCIATAELIDWQSVFTFVFALHYSLFAWLRTSVCLYVWGLPTSMDCCRMQIPSIRIVLSNSTVISLPVVQWNLINMLVFYNYIEIRWNMQILSSRSFTYFNTKSQVRFLFR